MNLTLLDTGVVDALVITLPCLFAVIPAATLTQPVHILGPIRHPGVGLFSDANVNGYDAMEAGLL